MAPNVTGSTGLFLAGAEVISSPPITPKEPVSKRPGPVRERPQYPWKIVWRNVIAFIYLHVGAVYGLYLCFVAAKWQTVIWGKL